MDFDKVVLAGLAAIVFSIAAWSQTAPPAPSADSAATPSFQVSALRMSASPDGAVGSAATQDPAQSHGFAARILRRGLADQRGLYAAPFKPSNFKWDALVLAGTGALLATDRRIENQLPDGPTQRYQNSSNIALGGLAASAAGLWAYGLKTSNPHATETGNLELETLTNTFLFYAPMQFIAGRQRPGEGNGNGDFFRHHSMNTSFPGGHAMFTWGMATVLAREYPKTWVRVLAYGAAGTVTVSRFMAHDHWSSDMLVGSVLGFAIGTHIFHSHCDPELSSSCHRRVKDSDQP
ncbi:MAG TPA: phosphatase PAP2 family protein [Terriglobales bacterium]|jgi:membrane-associated phospholipid phosphatase|nr:phosphatase PAP2 family protein [Terriglobales bacterium]